MNSSALDFRDLDLSITTLLLQTGLTSIKASFTAHELNSAELTWTSLPSYTVRTIGRRLGPARQRNDLLPGSF